MQKLLNLLEQHVQWLVLGLGAAFLLFMVWTYVINNPVSVEVAGQTVAPAKVDPIVKEKADQLDRAVKAPGELPPVEVPDPVAQFLSVINAAPQASTLPAVAFTPPTGKLDAVAQPNPGIQNPNIPQPQVPERDRVAKLPTPPKPVDVMTRRGRSTVSVPDANGAVDPNRTSDKDWVTVRFTVKRDELKTSFEEVKIPPTFMKALFLQAELMREEQLPDGSWGNQMVVPLLKSTKAPAFPGDGDRAGQITYNEWARANQPEILQPVFYTVAKGDRWGAPGMEDRELAPVAENAVFDPLQYLEPSADLSKLTPEQRGEVMKARQAANAERARNRQQNPGTGRQPRGGEEGGVPGGRRGGSGPGAGGPPSSPFQQRPGEFVPTGEGGMPGMNPGMNPGMQQTINNVDYSKEFPLPQGEFNPTDAAVADVTGWIHDETVQPGAVYRYKVRYKIKNPIYQTRNIAKNAADEAKFAITSVESEWTSPVTIPALTSFYLSSNFDADSSRNVKFEVFKFQDGVLHSKIFTVAPGDMIGKTEGGIDFSTGWTLVDMRDNAARSNSDFAVITNNEGRLQQRAFTSDRDDPEAKKLRQKVTEEQARAGG